MISPNTPLGTIDNEPMSTPVGSVDEETRRVTHHTGETIVQCLGMAHHTDSKADEDTALLVHVEVESNADLYNLTPPAYTQSIAEGERTADAEATQDEKPSPVHERSPERHVLAQTSPRPMSVHTIPRRALSEHSVVRPVTPLSVLQERAQENTALLAPTGPSPTLSHYLTEPVATASLVGARECSILRDRPAIWLVRNRKMALSPLAAAVLTKEGLLGAKDLEL